MIAISPAIELFSNYISNIEAHVKIPTTKNEEKRGWITSHMCFHVAHFSDAWLFVNSPGPPEPNGQKIAGSWPTNILPGLAFMKHIKWIKCSPLCTLFTFSRSPGSRDIVQSPQNLVHKSHGNAAFVALFCSFALRHRLADRWYSFIVYIVNILSVKWSEWINVRAVACTFYWTIEKNC